MKDAVNFKRGAHANLLNENGTLATAIQEGTFYITKGDDKEYDMYLGDKQNDTLGLHKINRIKWGSFNPDDGDPEILKHASITIDMEYPNESLYNEPSNAQDFASLSTHRVNGFWISIAKNKANITWRELAEIIPAISCSENNVLIHDYYVPEGRLILDSQGATVLPSDNVDFSSTYKTMILLTCGVYNLKNIPSDVLDDIAYYEWTNTLKIDSGRLTYTGNVMIGADEYSDNSTAYTSSIELITTSKRGVGVYFKVCADGVDTNNNNTYVSRFTLYQDAECDLITYLLVKRNLDQEITPTKVSYRVLKGDYVFNESVNNNLLLSMEDGKYLCSIDLSPLCISKRIDGRELTLEKLKIYRDSSYNGMSINSMEFVNESNISSEIIYRVPSEEDADYSGTIYWLLEQNRVMSVTEDAELDEVAYRFWSDNATSDKELYNELVFEHDNTNYILKYKLNDSWISALSNEVNRYSGYYTDSDGAHQSPVYLSKNYRCILRTKKDHIIINGNDFVKNAASQEIEVIDLDDGGGDDVRQVVSGIELKLKNFSSWQNLSNVGFDVYFNFNASKMYKGVIAAYKTSPEPYNDTKFEVLYIGDNGYKDTLCTVFHIHETSGSEPPDYNILVKSLGYSDMEVITIPVGSILLESDYTNLKKLFDEV